MARQPLHYPESGRRLPGRHHGPRDAGPPHQDVGRGFHLVRGGRPAGSAFQADFLHAAPPRHGRALDRHIAFGSILGDDRKPFKTRSGDTVSLQDVLDEAIERAARVVEEKSPDMPEEEKKRVAEVVGHRRRAASAELSQNRMTDYVFNWDKMLALQGDTAPYLQNSYVRVRSIFRKLDGGPLELVRPHSAFGRRGNPSGPASGPLRGSGAGRCLDDCRPNMLAAYLFDLARGFPFLL